MRKQFRHETLRYDRGKYKGQGMHLWGYVHKDYLPERANFSKQYIDAADFHSIGGDVQADDDEQDEDEDKSVDDTINDAKAKSAKRKSKRGKRKR